MITRRVFLAAGAAATYSVLAAQPPIVDVYLDPN